MQKCFKETVTFSQWTSKKQLVTIKEVQKEKCFSTVQKKATMEEAIEHLKCQKISSAHLHSCKTMGSTLFHTGLS